MTNSDLSIVVENAFEQSRQYILRKLNQIELRAKEYQKEKFGAEHTPKETE